MWGTQERGANLLLCGGTITVGHKRGNITLGGTYEDYYYGGTKGGIIIMWDHKGETSTLTRTQGG